MNTRDYWIRCIWVCYSFRSWVGV